MVGEMSEAAVWSDAELSALAQELRPDLPFPLDPFARPSPWARAADHAASATPRKRAREAAADGERVPSEVRAAAGEEEEVGEAATSLQHDPPEELMSQRDASEASLPKAVAPVSEEASVALLGAAKHLQDAGASEEQRSTRCRSGLKALLSLDATQLGAGFELLSISEAVEEGVLTVCQATALPECSARAAGAIVEHALLPRVLALQVAASRTLFSAVRAVLEQQHSRQLVHHLMLPVLRAGGVSASPTSAPPRACAHPSPPPPPTPSDDLPVSSRGGSIMAVPPARFRAGFVLHAAGRSALAPGQGAPAAAPLPAPRVLPRRR